MNELISYISLYVLILAALVLTVGFAWLLVVGRHIAKRNRFYYAEWEEMQQRIRKRKELNGRGTDHQVDLAAKEGRGGWVGGKK